MNVLIQRKPDAIAVVQIATVAGAFTAWIKFAHVAPVFAILVLGGLVEALIRERVARRTP